MHVGTYALDPELWDALNSVRDKITALTYPAVRTSLQEAAAVVGEERRISERIQQLASADLDKAGFTPSRGDMTITHIDYKEQKVHVGLIQGSIGVEQPGRPMWGGGHGPSHLS